MLLYAAQLDVSDKPKVNVSGKQSVDLYGEARRMESFFEVKMLITICLLSLTLYAEILLQYSEEISQRLQCLRQNANRTNITTFIL